MCHHRRRPGRGAVGLRGRGARVQLPPPAIRPAYSAPRLLAADRALALSGAMAALRPSRLPGPIPGSTPVRHPPAPPHPHSTAALGEEKALRRPARRRVSAVRLLRLRLRPAPAAPLTVAARAGPRLRPQSALGSRPRLGVHTRSLAAEGLSEAGCHPLGTDSRAPRRGERLEDVEPGRGGPSGREGHAAAGASGLGSSFPWVRAASGLGPSHFSGEEALTLHTGCSEVPNAKRRATFGGT